MAGRAVLVIGGTGFLGHRITEEFLRLGDDVTVLSRGLRPSALAEHVYVIHVDRRDPNGMWEALGRRPFDVVVDNIAYDADDVRITLAALDPSRTGHYLLTSSSAVYADRYVRRPIRESDANLSLRVAVDAPNPFHSRLGHGYANNKRAAEQVIMESQFNWSVLRAPVVLGADDRTLRVWWFVQRLLDGEPIIIPDWGPGRIFQVVWANDVARAFGAAAGNAAAFGRAYNVGQAEIYTAESWVGATAALLDRPPRYVHVPESSLPDLDLADYLLPVAGRPFGHVLLDLSAIRCDIGFEPSPESVWLAETVRTCAAHPPQADSPHYDRREAEIRAAHRVGSPSKPPAGR